MRRRRASCFRRGRFRGACPPAGPGRLPFLLRSTRRERWKPLPPPLTRAPGPSRSQDLHSYGDRAGLRGGCVGLPAPVHLLGSAERGAGAGRLVSAAFPCALEPRLAPARPIHARPGTLAHPLPAPRLASGRCLPDERITSLFPPAARRRRPLSWVCSWRPSSRWGSSSASPA